MTARPPLSAAARLALGCIALQACEPRITSLGAYIPPTGQYLEAEAGELSGGFLSQDDAAASGARCITPPDAIESDDQPGSARADYHFEIARAANYLIWARFRGPDATHNRLWFQVDAGTWHKWRISTGEIFFWDTFHEDRDYGNALMFELTTGAHSLSIANCVDGVALDRLYVTADGDTPPGNDTTCSPPHSIQIGTACQPSCGSHGVTTCGADACAGKPPLAAYDCDICCLEAP
jgi:hypothetical protein